MLIMTRSRRASFLPASLQETEELEFEMGMVRSRAVALMCGVALGLIGVQGAAAQSNANARNVTLLERLVIGLGGAPKVAIDTPQAVTVVSQEDIDIKQAGTTGELFDSVPGVTMVGSDRQFGEAF